MRYVRKYTQTCRRSVQAKKGIRSSIKQKEEIKQIETLYVINK